MKSNNGIFILDDFGRQLVRPRDLLNRWIVPLENRLDYLTLHTGNKFQVPFDQLTIFSTNINPKDLLDDAFMRAWGTRFTWGRLRPRSSRLPSGWRPSTKT